MQIIVHLLIGVVDLFGCTSSAETGVCEPPQDRSHPSRRHQPLEEGEELIHRWRVIYWLMPIDRSHLGTSKEGHAFWATWLCPMILTLG